MTPGIQTASARFEAREKPAGKEQIESIGRVIDHGLLTMHYQPIVDLETREIFAQKAFDPYRDAEIKPGSAVQSDTDIDAFVAERADSAYHPSCTCKMGHDDMAVVDPETRVRGIEGLRVVDAAIMPSIVSGNLNAPTIMIAEKAADIILGNRPLPASNAPYHVPNNWQTEQR